MILKQFPDINMVRRLRNNAASPADKWMNVALNVKCREASRTGVESPYSLFLNTKGFSYCAVNQRQYRIETDTFLLTRPGDLYDLTIDNIEQTEICNIHINNDFFYGVAHSLTTSGNKLLDQDHDRYNAPDIFTHLYQKDNTIRRLTAQLTVMNAADTAGFELLLSNIIEHLLVSAESTRRKIIGLPYLKASVKADIYRRLALACDLIYSGYQQPLCLDELCREVCMSKFHFLRMFKSLYGITPYQYLGRIRMKKALELLKSTGKTIREISDSLGYEYPNSFIKAFHNTYGIPPLQYRKQ